MFGRQDSDDTTSELDNEHADYVTDLTAQDDTQTASAAAQSSPFGSAGITPPPGTSPFCSSPVTPPSQTTDDSSSSDAPSKPADAFEPASAPALPADDDSPSDDNADNPDKNAVAAPSTRGESSSAASAPGENALLDIKRSALNDLSPLVEHLDQSPEEQFRTTMMLIQATDNQDLIKEAYAAAQKISDEKVRAQALLDVINEINYFTHQKDSD